MIRFSANLGFLWNDRSLPDAIHAAKAAGFHAVECHWPYATPAADVVSALQDTGLKMLGLNTQRGNVNDGENGLSALVGRETEARNFIDQAVEYAAQIDCSNIHVMAGFTDKGETAQNTFAENLKYACHAAAAHGQTILVEPLNKYDAPNYHVSTLDEALAALEAVGEPNLKVMFDCYHMQIMGGDLLRRFKMAKAEIGHVQFASTPDRTEPDKGEVDFTWLLNEISAAGFAGPFGAEYKPRTTTDGGLGWMQAYSG